jgi:hypothetical protein
MRCVMFLLLGERGEHQQREPPAGGCAHQGGGGRDAAAGGGRGGRGALQAARAGGARRHARRAPPLLKLQLRPCCCCRRTAQGLYILQIYLSLSNVVLRRALLSQRATNDKARAPGATTRALAAKSLKSVINGPPEKNVYWQKEIVFTRNAI